MSNEKDVEKTTDKKETPPGEDKEKTRWRGNEKWMRKRKKKFTKGNFKVDYN